MSQPVDELFGEGEGAPAPRTGLILSLLVSGLLTALIGMLCTTAPGGLLVLLAWLLVEKEMDRIDSGYLPSDARPHVQRLRTFTYAGVLVVIGLFVAQGFLLCGHAYDGLWLSMLGWLLGEPVGGGAPLPP